MRSSNQTGTHALKPQQKQHKNTHTHTHTHTHTLSSVTRLAVTAGVLPPPGVRTPEPPRCRPPLCSTLAAEAAATAATLRATCYIQGGVGLGGWTARASCTADGQLSVGGRSSGRARGLGAGVRGGLGAVRRDRETDWVMRELLLRFLAFLIMFIINSGTLIISLHSFCLINK